MEVVEFQFTSPIPWQVNTSMLHSFLSLVVLLHAATRKRNLKNKFANTVEHFKKDVSPMTIILSEICDSDEEGTNNSKR